MKKQKVQECQMIWKKGRWKGNEKERRKKRNEGRYREMKQERRINWRGGVPGENVVDEVEKEKKMNKIE